MRTPRNITDTFNFSLLDNWIYCNRDLYNIHLELIKKLKVQTINSERNHALYRSALNDTSRKKFFD
ncbi:hypothetical protein [Aquella oligotrophica]|uniref:Uncharacterized protein n=1 Tax=Aquella oligotrophica TaxID=2067065 RepID=A0A2I7N8N0_9NEIS|nr:hypothetical protein [Aquella oligotrophica]AUR52802.1 hypothetical protein CUN60_11025 [Aquella oligotrophica]